MDETSEKLQDWWKLDEPPERDSAFRFAVMARIERRRVWSEWGQTIAMALVVGLVAWILAPTFESIVRISDATFVVTVALGIMAALAAESGLFDS